MVEFFIKLFSSDLGALGECLRWSGGLITLFVFSDILVFAGLLAAGLALVLVIHKELFPPLHRILFIAAAAFFGLSFIFMLEVFTIWNGVFRFSGLLRLVTALILVAVNFYLWPFMFQAIARGGKFTSDDEKQVFKQKEKKMQQMQSSLGKLVEERTNRVIALEDELEKLSTVNTSRERRLNDLKIRINDLLTEMGREVDYPELKKNVETTDRKD